MSNTSRIAILCVNILLCVASIILTYFFMGSWGVLIRVAFYALAGIGIIVSALTFFLKKLAIFKSAFILIILAVIVLCAFITVSEVGHLNDYENDEDKINGLVNMINSTGAWGMVVFVLIQVLQIVVLPLPAIVCYVPGTIVWGPLIATLLASAGVIIGSVIAYFIGRFWGKKAVIWIAGKEATEKYASYFGKRGKVIFVLMQILPFFPDDILCMVAGLTSMNFAFFFVAILLVRPLIISAYCYLGSGTVIPFEGWGIAVWIVIFAVFIVLAVLSLKYQDKFESWLLNKFSRKKKALTPESTLVEDAGEKLPPDEGIKEPSPEIQTDVDEEKPEKKE